MSTDFDLGAFLEERRRRVEEALEAQVATWEERVTPRLWEAMRYGLLGGGKRIRPVLSLAAFEACGGSAQREGLVRDFAVAIECVHSYSLIHDDLPSMDDDELRRGRPTCHIVFGEALAILAGDALLTEAFGILGRGGAGREGQAIPNDEVALRSKLVGLLAGAAGAAGMVGGQALDLAMSGSELGSFTLEDLEGIHSRKTGALLQAAVVGGAVAAGASDEVRAALERYGEAIGLAFQIADDILDETGDPAKMGKAGGSDRAKGKATYPALLGLDASRELARSAAERASASLAPLGDNALPLRELSAYVVERAT